MPAGQSNWGNFFTEVPSPQMFLVVSIWQKNLTNTHFYLQQPEWTLFLLSENGQTLKEKKTAYSFCTWNPMENRTRYNIKA